MMNTDPTSQGGILRSIILRGIVVVVLAVGTYFLCHSTPESNPPSEAGLTMRLPSVVGDFAGSATDISESEKVMLPKDTQFARTVYHNYGNDEVNCEIVLSGGEKRSIHRPEICLPSQGWNQKSGEVIPIKLKNGGTLNVMKLTITRVVEPQPGVHKELTALFIYWFVGKGITTPYHWYRILHTDLDRVLYNVNHRWAYVIVSAPVLQGFKPNGKDTEQTLDELKKFISELAPDILKPETIASELPSKPSPTPTPTPSPAP
jgi:hypothetical protein